MKAKNEKTLRGENFISDRANRWRNCLRWNANDIKSLPCLGLEMLQKTA
jgi:hypothetical protein